LSGNIRLKWKETARRGPTVSRAARKTENFSNVRLISKPEEK